MVISGHWEGGERERKRCIHIVCMHVWIWMSICVCLSLWCSVCVYQTGVYIHVHPYRSSECACVRACVCVCVCICACLSVYHCMHSWTKVCWSMWCLKFSYLVSSPWQVLGLPLAVDHGSASCAPPQSDWNSTPPAAASCRRTKSLAWFQTHHLKMMKEKNTLNYSGLQKSEIRMTAIILEVEPYPNT